MNKRMKVVYFYGNDNELRVGPPSLLLILSDYWFLSIWFLFTTILLHAIRLKARIKNASISSSILDTITIFFSGGNIRFRYKIENYFLIVLLGSMFFLQSLWVSDFISKISALKNVNKVDTLEKLSELNTPIYFAHIVDATEKKNLIKLLKYVCYTSLLFCQ